MNLRFENDVKTYSIQTAMPLSGCVLWFENDVKTYSIQTGEVKETSTTGLRMM